MSFGCVLRAEVLKLKRTAALRMTVAAPATIVLLMLFVTSQSPFTMLRRVGPSNDWIALAHVNFLLWGLLTLPLFLTVQCSLVAGVDHADNQWKLLLARPVPRYVFYLAKLAVVSSLTALSAGILLAGIFLTGLVLPYLQKEAVFGGPIPVGVIVREGYAMTALALLPMALQHWISLRLRSFAASTASGVVAMIMGYGMVIASQPNGAWTQYFPWSLPMLVLTRVPVDIATVLLVSTAAAGVVTLAGCVDFSRREVT